MPFEMLLDAAHQRVAEPDQSTLPLTGMPVGSGSNQMSLAAGHHNATATRPRGENAGLAKSEKSKAQYPH
jgi:hypothetical protein